jgi:hypothetical protein
MTPTKSSPLIRVLPVILAFAFVGCGDSGDNTLSFLDDPIPDTTPPGAPTNLAVSHSGAALLVSWAENTEPDLAGYVLQRSLDRGSSWSSVADSALTEASFEDNYYTRADYRVAAVDSSANQSAYTLATYIAPSDPRGSKYPANQI